MYLVDIVLRYVTLGLLILLIIMLLRDSRKLIQAKLGILACISIAALLLWTDTAPAIPQAFKTLMGFASLPNLPLLWLFGLSLFNDQFRVDVVKWVICGVYTLMMLYLHLTNQGLKLFEIPYFSMLLTLSSLILMVHLLWSAVNGIRDDLVESRRNGRIWFVLCLCLAGVSAIFLQNILKLPSAVSLVSVAFPSALMALLWASRIEPNVFMFDVNSRTQPVKTGISSKDIVAYERLIALMNDDHAYKNFGLTIVKLAKMTKVPEHQLRVLINQGMGYRNFSNFLNSYRLKYTKSIMSDVNHARLPILTIAMDAGYNSLATFNRAFKLAENQTPSAYRKAALSKYNQN